MTAGNLSRFIRAASDDEKAEVYGEVMDAASCRQALSVIVAAPDLLSALRVARQALADYLPAHRNEVTDAAIAAADAAIARATGHDG